MCVASDRTDIAVQAGNKHLALEPAQYVSPVSRQLQTAAVLWLADIRDVIILVAVCVSGCGSGTCIQPNKCQCSDGSVASTCSTHNSATGKKDSSVVVQKLGPSTFTSKSSEQQCTACVAVTHVMYTISNATKLVCTYCNFLQPFFVVLLLF